MAYIFNLCHIKLSEKAKWLLFGFILVYATLLTVCVMTYASDHEHKIASADVLAEKDTDELSASDKKDGSPAQSGFYPIEIDKGYEKGAYDNFRYIFSSDQADDIKGALDFSIKGKKMAIKESIEAIYRALSAIGLALVVIFMLMDVIDKMTRDLIDGETLLRIFIKFIIIKAAIDSGTQILDAIFRVGASLTSELGNAGIKEIDDFLWKLADWIQDSDMFYCFAILFCSFIPYLIAWLLNLVILATAYGRIITIIVRGGFAPIACASMVQDGFSGTGMRYLKKFFGCVIQGGVILAIIIAGRTVMKYIIADVMGTTNTLASLGDFIGAVLSCLVVLFTEVMLVLKSEQTAMDIVGA